MYDKLPSELKENALFCLWRYEERDGQITKVPYQINGKRANPANKHIFSDYRLVVGVASDYAGIGIGVFGNYCAINIDHCAADSKLTGMALDIVNIMNSYTELSPSGTGVRIIFKAGDLTYDKKRYYINNRKLGLEVYVTGKTNRFATLTGDAIRGCGIEERSAELTTVLEKDMVRTVKAQKPETTAPGSYLSDESLISKAIASKQGKKFKALWNGGIPDGKSHREADQVLCTMLAFWCGGDIAQMEDGQYKVVPDEAKIVKAIFTDYLSGMGIESIAKKLNEAGIRTRRGYNWGRSSVDKVLHNYCYIGNLLLLKTYRENHITKRTLKNNGELPQYHAADTHETIIPFATFEAVQSEIAKRAVVHAHPQKKVIYPFTGLITCGYCGKHYRRKITHTGPVWICATFNTQGKSYGASKQIPESILIALSAEILGTEALDGIHYKITAITGYFTP